METEELRNWFSVLTHCRNYPIANASVVKGLHGRGCIVNAGAAIRTRRGLHHQALELTWTPWKFNIAMVQRQGHVEVSQGIKDHSEQWKFQVIKWNTQWSLGVSIQISWPWQIMDIFLVAVNIFMRRRSKNSQMENVHVNFPQWKQNTWPHGKGRMLTMAQSTALTNLCFLSCASLCGPLQICMTCCSGNVMFILQQYKGRKIHTLHRMERGGVLGFHMVAFVPICTVSFR